MAVKGKVTFYQMTSATDTENIITTNKVECDGNAITPDGRTGIDTFHPRLGRHKPENPLPHANQANKPDTGFAGDTYTFNLIFDEEDGEGTALAIAKFRDWMRGEQTVDNEFDEGNIGLRNDYRPEFNLLPDNTAGYKVISFEINQDLNKQNFTYAILILEFSGDPTRLGVVSP